MKIGTPKEVVPGETRTAAVPETVKQFVTEGLEVVVESGLGGPAFLADERYAAAGATVVPDAATLYAQADIVLKVAPPAGPASDGRSELAHLRGGTILIAALAAASHPDLVKQLAQSNVTSFSLDVIPRITRAQSMDVLSSMSTIAGYKAVIMAADELSKMMPMLMTPAGTLRPANALVIGAGVAGLQAIATAKRLGAVVAGVDVRPAVQEQVESLGAKFVVMEVDHTAEDAGGYAADLGEAFYRQEQEILAPHLKRADIVITTALIPGRPAPKLITESMVDRMQPGSVIVDLAATAGGNCALTAPQQRIVHKGVVILGPTNLPAAMPVHASFMFARNAAAFVRELVTDGRADIDMANPIIRETLITHEGAITNLAAKMAVTEGGRP